MEILDSRCGSREKVEFQPPCLSQKGGKVSSIGWLQGFCYLQDVAHPKRDQGNRHISWRYLFKQVACQTRGQMFRGNVQRG